MKLMSAINAAAGFVAAVLVASPALSQSCSASCEWGYGPGDGPASWAEICCPVCDGNSQSPIDIRSPDAVRGELAELELNYGESHLEFANNGHTLEAVNALGDVENYLQVGETRYPLTQFHFHSLSEHTIDGRHAPMELHLVHQRTSYDVAVVAVLIEEGDHKPAYNALWNSLPADSKVEPRTVVLNPKRLIPNQLSHYTYRGSLTTPNCSEVVTWYVLDHPMSLSVEQIEAFRAIFAQNYRPTQPLNGRVVSFSE